MSPPGKSTPAEAQPARLGRAQGGPRRLVTPELSNVSLGGDSHCALQGSLHADGVQCLLLSLGLTYSLKSQHPLEPPQQENGQLRSNPGRPHSGPLLRPIRGLRDHLWKGKDVSGGFNDASWEGTSTVSSSSVQEAGELRNR